MLAALTTLAVVPAVEASFRLFLMGLGPIVWPIAILTLAGALVLAWFYISDAVKRLALAEQNNVSCGRLDPANATWNIVAPLFWSLSQQPAHKPRAGIQGLAALAGAISLAILGQLGLLRSPLTWGSFLLLFGLVIFVVAMKSATIGIQLLRWEHKWNRKIHLIA